MTTDITTFDQATALTGRKAIEFFSNKENVEPLIEMVKQEAISLVPDVSTKKGRDAIGSTALKVSKSRKALEDAINKSVADMKAKVATANDVKKYVTSELNQVRADVLKPRDEWQAEQDRLEEVRIAEIKERIGNIENLGKFSDSDDKESLGSKIDALNAMDLSEGFEEFAQDAIKAKEAAIKSLNDRVTFLVNKAIEEDNARKLAEEQEKLVAQKRDTEITARIQNLQGIPFAMFNSTAKEVQDKLDALNNHKPTVEDFGERHQEAVTAFDSVIANLTQLLGQKQQMEAIQAQQEEEQRRLTDEILVSTNDSADHSDDCKGCPDCQGINCAITEQAVKEELETTPYALPESEKAMFNDVIADSQDEDEDEEPREQTMRLIIEEGKAQEIVEFLKTKYDVYYNEQNGLIVAK